MNAPSPGAPDWRTFPVAQQPDWPDRSLHREVLGALAAAPPLVAPGECDRLRDRLAAVARGEMFLLQGGPCAEIFADAAPVPVTRELRTLDQMATILSGEGGRPVVKVGRLAGQYAKPRSGPLEHRDGVALPVYRGEAVNGREFTAEARVPDSGRLRRAYEASMSTLETVRAHERAWATEIFTSHEGLLLDYEDALTRPDRAGRRYAMSAHLLWIGERTRELAGAHVAYFSRIHNPIAIKLGPTATASTVLEYVDRLDPEREPGRLTFIIRAGAAQIRDRLPELVEKAEAETAQVVWVCDPMHGNTFESANGFKTRRFDTIVDEVTGFFEVHRTLGTHPGGIHIELTGADVTECVGGSEPVRVEELPLRYHTACDPRLNRSQSLELASLVAELMRQGRRPELSGDRRDARGVGETANAPSLLSGFGRSASGEDDPRTAGPAVPAAQARATPGHSTSHPRQQ